jgi:hypothetical protein
MQILTKLQLLIFIILISCNKEKIEGNTYISFNLDNIILTSKASAKDSLIFIELSIKNQNPTDTFWIPISQWEIDGVFEEQGSLSKGFPKEDYVVNYFIISPKDSTLISMLDKAPGPIYDSFPKLWQIEPNTQKRIKVKFKLPNHLKENIDFELLTYIPITSNLNLNKLYLQIPFVKDNSSLFISDELELSFNSINGLSRPWLNYQSSTVKIDSIYDSKIIETIKKESVRSTDIINNLVKTKYNDIWDNYNGLQENIYSSNLQIVSKYFQTYYGLKIINTFQQRLKCSCEIEWDH